MRLRIAGLLVLGLFLFAACNNDDDNGVALTPTEPYATQVAKDHDSIEEYLKTHFYNYEEFANPPENFDYQIKLDTIEGDNAGKTPLLDQMSVKEILLSDKHNEDVKHNLYYLVVKEGIGEGNPSISDSLFVNYEGLRLDNKLFDKSVNPVWFDGLAAVRGFREGIEYLKPGGTSTSNPDGTVSVEGFGIGMFVFPSALGYYNVNDSGLRTRLGGAYPPLIFLVDLLKFDVADHDRDGIPSIQEDLDGDKNLFNDDTDEDRTPNYNDIDDDNDGILTKEEITINPDGTITFKDSDGDGTPDHLDKDS